MATVSELDIRLDKGSKQSKFAQIQDAVVRLIDEGRLEEGDRLPPIREWAEDVGVAYATMCRAVNELVERGVLHARPKTGTVVAPRRPTGRHRVGTIGVVCECGYEKFMSQSRYYSLLTPCLQDEMLQRGERVSFERWDEDEAISAKFDHLRLVDGLMILGNAHYPVERILAVERLGVPVVMVGGEVTDERVHIVRTDDVADTRDAVLALVRMGHRSIAAWTTDQEDPRLTGYQEALKMSGLDARREFVFAHADYESIAHTVRALRDPPTALIALRNLNWVHDFAVSLRAAGTSLGKEFFLCAYDEDLWNGLAPLGIPYARIEQPVRELGRIAAEVMIDRIEGKYAGARHRLLRSNFRCLNVEP